LSNTSSWAIENAVKLESIAASERARL
jgi:hypothetical protein